MSGVKQFDEDAVITRAMTLFWEKGYGATTMSDLAEATGVLRGSLYNAYGDKDGIMLRALDCYAEQQGAPARNALAAADVRTAIGGFLDAHIARMANKDNPSGCLMCQTALELGERDSEIADKVRMQFQRTETALGDALRAGQDNGQLAATANVTELARFYLGVSRGMAVLHRAYRDLDAVRDAARASLRLLDCTA